MRQQILNLFTTPRDMSWEDILLNIVLAAVLGFAVAALLRKSAEGLGSMEMPFGPYLCLAAWVTLLWGHDLWRLWIQFILSI